MKKMGDLTKRQWGMLYVCATLVQICACASTMPSIGYTYYGLGALPPDAYATGKLLGKSGEQGWPDLTLTACEPDAISQGKCIVLVEAQFYSMVKELLTLRQEYSDLQQKCTVSNP